MHRGTLVVLVIAGMTICAGECRAATAFLGGDLNLAGGWSNGLPGTGNPGTIGVDGTNGSTVFNFGNGSVVDQSAGTITSTDGFNLTGGTWNMGGGRIRCRYFLSNGAGTVINLSGGRVELKDAAGTQYVGVANGGILEHLRLRHDRWKRWPPSRGPPAG